MPGGGPFDVVEEGEWLEVIDLTSEDGEEWFLVQSVQGFGPDSIFGWIPAVIGEVPSVLPLEDRSCGTASVGGLPALAPNERLACWGNDELSLEGYLISVADGSTGEYVGRPAWLAGSRRYILVTAIGPAVDAVPFVVRFPPDVGTPPVSPSDGPEGTVVQLTGHFDDPASATCQRHPTESDLPDLPHELDVLWCRQQFVVSEASAE